MLSEPERRRRRPRLGKPELPNEIDDEELRLWRTSSPSRTDSKKDGSTSSSTLPADNPGEFPTLAAVPHATVPPGFTYDGQFYAQLALDPLLRNPAIDRALDQPPYRARRILFSWTAWLAGFGRPWWVPTSRTGSQA